MENELEYYKKECESLFDEAALKLSAEDYERLSEWLKENGIV